MDFIEVPCPDCGCIMIVNRKTGKVVETRHPLLDEEERSGDRFEDARERVRQADDRIEKKVAEAKRAEKEKLARLDKLFKERKSEIEEKGEEVERPDIFRD